MKVYRGPNPEDNWEVSQLNYSTSSAARISLVTVVLSPSNAVYIV